MNEFHMAYAIVKKWYFPEFRISRLEGKFEGRSEFVAATLEVQQIDVGGDGQVAGGKFARVASSESARVHEFVLGGDAWASGGFMTTRFGKKISFLAKKSRKPREIVKNR